MEYRIATADELTPLAVLRWQDCGENGSPPRTCDEFVPVLLAGVEEVKATHTPFAADPPRVSSST